MILGVLKERYFDRVAITPKGFAKLRAAGIEPIVEANAGQKSQFSDEDYQLAGFRVTSRAELISSADIVVSIAPIELEELRALKKGAIYISMFGPYQDDEIVASLAQFPLYAYSMDMIPRTTLAQSMDVLSSMASLAGYKAVLKAADHFQNMLPMMMTAAGTIPPTKVLIIGAGVAGLQAIATAKRLGAVVEAFDTRLASKDEVMSLGASFVEVEGAVDDKGAGGYAVEQSAEYLAKQRILVHEKASKANIIITTAQIRGKKAPILIAEDTVRNMKAGSIIVDLAASTGGNCAFTQDNTMVNIDGVSIIGNSHLADQLATTASELFSNNILNFLKILVIDGKMIAADTNEILKAALISSPTQS